MANWVQKLHSCEARQFEALEEMAADFRKDHARTEDGGWKLALFYESINDTYKDGNREKVKQFIRVLEDWGKSKPSSITQRIVLADAYTGLSWAYRGSGYASTVSKEQWERFSYYLEKANEILTEASKLPDQDPYLYALWLTVGKGLSFDKLTLYGLAAKGMEIEPSFFDIYRGMSHILLPRWFGDEGEVEAYAEWVADKTQNRLGDQLYTTVAEYVKISVGSQDYVEHNFRGQELERVIEILGPIPCNFYVINNFAWFAHYYDDRETARNFQ